MCCIDLRFAGLGDACLSLYSQSRNIEHSVAIAQQVMLVVG